MQVSTLDERINRLECLVLGAKHAAAEGGQRRPEEMDAEQLRSLTTRINKISATLQPLGPVQSSAAYSMMHRGSFQLEDRTAVEALIASRLHVKG